MEVESVVEWVLVVVETGRELLTRRKQVWQLRPVVWSSRAIAGSGGGQLTREG